MLSRLKTSLYSLVPHEDKEWWKLFKSLFIFSLILHLIAVIFSEGYHRPDEHLGMTRYLALKLGVWGDQELRMVNWEYVAKIRPWLQPAFYYLFAKPLQLMGMDSPFNLMLILRFISSALGLFSLLPIAFLSYKLFKNSLQRKISLWMLFTLWYLPFFHARTTAENFGITFFIFGISPLLFSLSESCWDPKKLNTKMRDINISPFVAFISGLLLGASFIFRYQMAVMIASAWFALLLFSRLRIKVLLYVALGITAMQLGGAFVDYWGYGEWVMTPWNYFNQNIFKGKASGFGVSPWYYYFTKTFAKGVPPLSLIYILPFFWIWIKKPLHLLTWITLPFIIIHSLIGHKELRFIFALGLFIPLILPYAEDHLKLLTKKWFKPILYLAIFQSSILILVSSFKPAFTPMPFYRNLYSQTPPIEKIYTLSVFRDQLKFYLKKPFEQVLIKDMTEVNNVLSSNSEKVWFLTNKFHHIKEFRNKSNCKESYISYPNWVFKLNIGNWMKRSKIWALYKCSKE